jgi:hypothetical protein
MSSGYARDHVRIGKGGRHVALLLPDVAGGYPPGEGIRPYQESESGLVRVVLQILNPPRLRDQGVDVSGATPARMAGLVHHVP